MAPPAPAPALGSLLHGAGVPPPRYQVEVGASEWQRLVALAGRLRSADAELDDARWCGPALAPGIGEGSAFLFEDHREIPLFETLAPSLEYRLTMLAGSGDILGVTGPRDPAFEAYCREALGLGWLEVRRIPGDMTEPVGTRCANDPEMVEDLAGRARRAGSLTIVPYIGMSSAWELGRMVARAGGAPIRVAAPPPALAERVNNKLWFAQLAREVFGPDAVAQAWQASGPGELRARLEAAARTHHRLVVKVPASAGGNGVVRFDGELVRAWRGEATVAWLTARLRAQRWRGDYPLILAVWDEAVSSPSVQLWVPRRGTGEPFVQAVFDQWLDPTGVQFAGAITSELPARWQQHLAEGATRLGLVLQELGYYGQCSFDALLVGDDLDTARLHWIECNGRWGGVSTAVVAAHRLTGGVDCPIAIIHRRHPIPPRSMPQVLEQLGEDAFHRRCDGTGAVVVTPERMAAGTGLNLFVIGRSVAGARGLAQALTARFE